MARRRHPNLDPCWENDFAFKPRVRMKNKRDVAPSNALEHSFKPRVMISVSMRQYHCADVGDVDAKDIHVVDRGFAPKPGIVQNRFSTLALTNGQEKRITMFRN